MIKTRLLVPPPPKRLVSRPRLQKRLSELRRSRLALVRAPAGAGKTILLTQWKAALDQVGNSTAWLSFDASDNHADAVLGYIAAMIGSERASLASICNRLMAIPESLFLFLDDADGLPPATLSALLALVQRAPPNIHFVLASRQLLDLPVARMRIQGALLEIEARDLSFTASEAAGLLPQLDEAEITGLIDETAGWAAGLSVAARAPGGRTRRGDLHDYFMEEAFGDQTEAVKDFLLDTALLANLDPAICDAVTGRNDSDDLLQSLERAGLLLDRIDEDRRVWRYNPAFVAFLRDLGEADRVRCAAVHERAAAWLVQADRLTDALEHEARAGNSVALADMLEEHCEALTYDGRIMVVAHFADLLPEELISARPKVLMTLAWLHTRQLKFADTQRLLDRAAECIDEIERHAEGESAESRMLRLMLKHRETVLATAQDDMTDVDAQSQSLLKGFGDSRPYITCSLYSQMVYAQCDQYRLNDFDRLEPQARLALDRSGYRFASIGLQASIGGGLFAAGRTMEASRTLEQAMLEAAHYQDADADMAGMVALPALPLAKLLYEWNERDRAAALVEEHLPVARNFGYSDQLIAGYITKGRLLQAANEDEAALGALNEGMRIAAECNLDRLRLSLMAEKVRMLIRTGHPDEAVALGQSEGVRLDHDAPDPRHNPTGRKEIHAFAWARLAQSCDRIGDAIAVAKQWRNFCSGRGAVRTLVRWHILLARLHLAAGDQHAAQRSLHDAIKVAAPGRFIRSFVDEGTAIQLLVSESHGQDNGCISGEPEPIEAFARTLLAAFGGDPRGHQPAAADTNDLSEGLYGRVNAKELEILTLVGRGLRNREIGARLGLTEGTVKWYMQQIYDKLGVRRRPQAVERARQFGMLA